MVPLLVALPVGSMLSWKRADLRAVTGRLTVAFFGTVAAVLLHVLLVQGPSAFGLLGFGLGIWVVLGSLTELAGRVAFPSGPLSASLARARGLPRSAWAMTVAHIGMGVLILGVTGVATGQFERILLMRPGDRTDLAGYSVTFEGVADAQGPNYTAQRATFDVRRGSRHVVTLHSEKRAFPVEGSSTTEAGIDSGLLRDIYVVLGEARPDGAWTVRMYHNPLAVWIWGGAVMMGLGGLISLTDRRLRVGAPRPSRARLAEAAAS
jgi:cytochrome c-type biogenesis protein CcmF